MLMFFAQFLKLRKFPKSVSRLHLRSLTFR